MFSSILKVGIRNLVRQKFYSILNIVGLGTALGIFLLIWLYVDNELSYDQFHPDLDQLYRVDQTFIWGDGFDKFGSTGPAVADAIFEAVLGISSVTRVMTPSSSLVTIGSDEQRQSYEELGVLAVDSSFFEVFPFPVLAGNPSTALTQPNSMVLTRSLAEKYFGSEDPLGASLEMRNGDQTRRYKVTAVVEDPPKQMHFQFTMLASLNSFENVDRLRWSWIWTGFVTYIKVRPDADIPLMQKQLHRLPSEKAEASLMRIYGQTFEEYTENGRGWHLYLTPVKDIWLYSADIPNRLGVVSDVKYVYLFGVIAILILILACVNYTNLATARYTGRIREVGVRKSLGADRQSLVVQFMAEAVLLSLAGTLLAIGLAEVAMPYFNDAFELNLSLSLVDPTVLLMIVAVTLLTSLLSGLYPSFYVTMVGPINALKGQVGNKSTGSKLRNALVVVQFFISISLIIFTTLVYKQLNFLQDRKLGFNKDNLIVISQTQRMGNAQTAFVEALRGNPTVKTISVSDATPPYIWNSDHFTTPEGEVGEIPISYVVGEEEYLQVLEVPLLYGRYFSEDFGDETKNVILNQKAIAALGWSSSEEVLNKKLIYTPSETRFNVIGVMEDFNFMSLDGNSEPFALFVFGAQLYSRDVNYVSIRLEPDSDRGDVSAFLASLDQEWRDFAPGLPFRYRFTDQAYYENFKAEQKLGNLLNFFTAFAIFIACMGLFGLASYTAQRRAKEIGIRKVLGASVVQIVLLLNMDFAKLALAAVLLAIPVASYLGSQWLQDFEFRTEFSVAMFVAATFAGLAMAAIAVVFQALKAARRNPAEVLHDD